MTIGEILQAASTIQPNQFSWNTRVAWLSDLDGKLKLWTEGMLGKSESEDDSSQSPSLYDWRETTDAGKAEIEAKEAFVPEPWAGDFYLNYLRAQMDLANDEIERYQFHISLFRQAETGFKDAWLKAYGNGQILGNTEGSGEGEGGDGESGSSNSVKSSVIRKWVF